MLPHTNPWGGSCPFSWGPLFRHLWGLSSLTDLGWIMLAPRFLSSREQKL